MNQSNIPLSKTRLYQILSGMKQRCNNPSDQHFKWYGGKGICVCSEWSGNDGAKNFAEWALSHGYNDDLTIDRIDSTKDYSPDNCRWVTASQNSRSAHTEMVSAASGVDIAMKIRLAETASGKSEAELARLLGTSPQAFGQRVKTGRFSSDDLEKIAAALGAKYVCYFEFPDGTQI